MNLLERYPSDRQYTGWHQNDLADMPSLHPARRGNLCNQTANTNPRTRHPVCKQNISDPYVTCWY